MLDQLHSIKTSSALFARFFILTILIGGCSSSQPFLQEDEKIKEASAKEEASKEKKLPLAAYEATLNPADFDKEIDVVQKAHAEEKTQQIPLEIPRDSMVVQEEPMQGFRIQVFSSSSVDEASLMKNIIYEKFMSDSIYLVYDPPVYKIRVGDFVNRYEANQRLPEFIEKGYRDAWIVPDRVIQRKLVRVPLQK